MASSDRSRTSDDRRYNYKAVVAQQGRVIVDRDLNALEDLLIERSDTDVLDIVGPAGTPDDGFAISVPAQSPPATVLSPGGAPSLDFTVGPGTMYVGGQRVEFPATLDGVAQAYSYYSQPDWLKPDDPVPSSSPPLSPSVELEVIWLDVRDHEVTATEDPDLKEVALGGPDTTARVRLMRRVRRTPVHDGVCVGAWLEATNNWSTQLGLAFDLDTMSLEPEVRLQVSFQQDPAAADPCDPVARGGYLYSQNQLIRVQISAAASMDGTPARFLWGYDNASFLYRVSSVTNAGTQLQLAGSPPDAFHWPKNGQVVEILRTAVVLGTAPDASNPEALIVRCVAESRGVIRTLSQSYGATTQGGSANYLTFTDPLPQDYLGLPTPLFVRIWQSEQDYPLDATGVALQDGSSSTTNGVVVTLTTPAGVPMTVGAFWMVALRPGTPQAVYPERFLNAPQPPDGPARWACPLATIDWSTQPPTVTDCRSQFDNLVTLTKRKPGCCTVSIRPETVTGSVTLQSIIDAAVKTAAAVKICFGPGIYLLSQSLRLGPQHAGIVLEACTEGAILRADARFPAANFQDGLLVLTDVSRVVLSGLYFESIDVPVLERIGRDLAILARIVAIEVEGLKRRTSFEQTRLWIEPEPVLTQAMTNLFTQICVRCVWCTNLTVTDCHFQVISTIAQRQRQNSIAIGLFVQGNCTGLTVTSCTFVGDTGGATLGLAATDTKFIGREAKAAAGASPAAAGAASPAATGKAKSIRKKSATRTASAAAASATAVTAVAPDPALLLRELPVATDFTRPAAVAERFPVAAGIGLLAAPWIAKESGQEDPVQLVFGEQTWLIDARLSGNTFDSLTLAIATLARTGTVRVADNTARRCVAGAWLATWHGSFIEWNPAQPLNRGADQLLFYSLLYVETVVGLFAPMLLPLPQQFARGDAILASPMPSLLITGNDFDCNSLSFVETAAASIALATFNDAPPAQARDTAVTIASSHLRSSSPTLYPTVLATVNGTLTMTGNNIANTGVLQTFAGPHSLWVDIDGVSDSGGDFVQLGLAVTGNVFQGSTNLSLLPRLGFSSPLDDWDTFNALL